jgi:hypothetical protein
MSDTPRTDAEEIWANSMSGDDFRCVDSSFARELERENNIMRKALIKIAEHFVCMEGPCPSIVEDALKEVDGTKPASSRAADTSALPPQVPRSSL